MKTLFSISIFFLFWGVYNIHAQQSDSSAAIKAIENFQAELNKQYKDPEKSPMEPKDRKKFKSHDFYPINLNYRVKAKIIVTPNEDFFEMKTTSGKTRQYRKYGELHFILNGNKYKLNVYQGKSLMEKPEYKDHLFLPFKDQTSGEETYGGGRYIDLKKNDNADELIIDFNLAYNPYCAYSDKYSCPIVPAENYLETEVKAGIKLKDDH